MAKKLFQSILILVLANLIIKPIWIFGIDLNVQNTVGAASYGVYFVVFNFSFLFHILLDFGINQFHNKELAQNHNLLKQRFGNLLFLKGFFSVAYFLVTFLLAYSLGFTVLQKEMLFFLALNQVFLSFTLFSRANFTALQWNKWNAFFSIFDRALSIVFCAILLYTTYFGAFNIMYFIYAQTLALFLAMLCSSLVLILKGKILKPSFDFKQFFPLIKRSFPYALVVLLMTIYTRIDAVMLDKLLPETGSEQAGIYAAAYRLLDAITMVPYLFASLLIPFFATKLKENSGFHKELWALVYIMLAISIPFVIVVYLFHIDFMFLLYPESSLAWHDSFQLLLYTFPLLFLGYIFGSFLTAAGKLKLISIFAFFTIILNLILNVFLIKSHGAAGAALATLLTQGLMALLQTVYVFLNWETHFEQKMLFRVLAYFVLIIVLVVGLNQFPLIWYYKMGIIILFAILLSLLLRLINLKKIQSLK